MILWTCLSLPFTITKHFCRSPSAAWGGGKVGEGEARGSRHSQRGGRGAITWSDFDRVTTAMARELLRLGFAKGDFLVTLLPMSVDHVLLEYSCFKIGVIVAPLDLRLSPGEVIRALEILRPRGFA